MNESIQDERRVRVRIRFRKEGDLRFISHRDLVRALERMFRRAGLRLAMTQGFHPRPRMTFPAALALGIEAWNEVAEVVLCEAPAEEELRQRFTDTAPPGLRIHAVQILAPEAAKAKVAALHYQYSLPPDEVPRIARRIAQWQQAESGQGRPEEYLDLPRDRVELRIAEGTLHMRLLEAQPLVKPQHVLAALGLAGRDDRVVGLVRSDVELVA